MILHVLFGKRNESYDGEFAPVALEIASEYDVDENPDFLPEQRAIHDKTGEYAQFAIVCIEVDSEDILNVLDPSRVPIAGRVSSPDPE